MFSSSGIAQCFIAFNNNQALKWLNRISYPLWNNPCPQGGELREGGKKGGKSCGLLTYISIAATIYTDTSK